ncbi:MAG: UDP-N-acetylglucosamine--N-acetylmuramyl-(pentapeptide) pyrophosphoryl-undecaprenol N-acetylglucosamine transferase, partial [Chlamydiia bacterium]|nr:UDP-N-acetylglucosamine--N-acetylmuramyl-(pentapeptide) pyrophosphoryl-undecaprenol N-acetylglucosamine transferase [Chlamydiia bacterium]
FMGGGLASNIFFDRASNKFIEVPSACPSTRHPIKFLKALGNITLGVIKSFRHLRTLRPQAVVAFGGFPCFPVLLAASLLRLPIVLHEGNGYPGRVVRFFSRFAHVIGLQIPEAAKYLKGRCVEVPLPLRDGYTRLFASKRHARESYGLDPERLTLLIFGGSQGALGLNSLACSAAAVHLAQRTKNFQVLHFTGDLATCKAIQEEYDAAGIQACVKTFETRMDQAWQAADLVISRAGASSLAEQMEFEVPGILLPYPYATDHHQEVNARYMQDTIGGAVNAGETGVDAEMLAQLVVDLLGEDRKRMKEMQGKIHEHKTGHRTQDLCSIVSEVAGIKVR